MSDAGGRRTATVTVLFCDLVASTERQSRRGDDAHDEFRRRFFGVLTACVRANHGEVVKNTGDGLMVVFRHSAADAVACAVQMHDEVDALDDDEPAAIYVGISAGEAADEDGDWFGTPVNEAARLCAAAQPGQTLTNEVVRALVGSRGTFGFRSVGPLSLKGLLAPVAGVEVLRNVEPAAPAGVHAEPARRRAWTRRPVLGAVAVVVVIAAVAAAIAVVNKNGATHAAPAGAAPGTTARNYPVSYVPRTCPTDDLARIPGLTCGVLTVPEDRSKPNGRVVKLGVERAPARGRATGDPVLDFGADDLAGSPARDHREEIQMDQRGWGGSSASSPVLTCPEYARIAPESLAKPSGDLGERVRGTAALRACHDRWVNAGVDLGAYDYLAVGDDAADLISALHLDHVNLVSGYVAAIGALETVRRLPGVVRTMTLQTPVPPGSSSVSDPTGELSAAFNAYAALCRADAVCHNAFPDLGAALERDYEVYRTRPRLVHADDGNGVTASVLLDGPRTALAVAGGLDDYNDLNVLAAGIAAKDRTPAIDALTAGRILKFDAQLLDPKFAWGAQLSGQCSYDRYTVGDGHVLSSSTVPQLSGVDDGFLEWACSAWKVDKIGAVAFEDASTDVPTFVVSGNLSSGASQNWPDTFQQSMANVTVAQFPTLNASLLNRNVPKCLADLRRRFLDDPTAALDAAGCVRKSPKITFVGSLSP